MTTLYDKLAAWMQQIGVSENLSTLILSIGAILVIIALGWVIDWICRKTIIPLIRRVTSKTESTWDDYLLCDDVLKNLCGLVSPIIIFAVIPFMLPEGDFLELLQKLCRVYIIIVVVRLICSFISSLYAISCHDEKAKMHSLKSFYQMLKLVVVCIGIIIIISILISKSLVTILAGLGAGTAILMLVFQDTIKGFVAGIQLMANDMLRPGDWITMPKYDADGDVLEVTLTTVKVQNWDKTIVTVPPYALVNDSFQNWRGMFDTGGRRVKRSINIDMNTVRFCTDEEMARYREQPWMQGFEPAETKPVNLHIFRQYVEYYLTHHSKVNADMTMLVRQLQPGPEGMPIELYFFTASTVWAEYEKIQAEVFDHIIAVLHDFDLRVFQNPSGNDIKTIS